MFSVGTSFTLLLVFLAASFASKDALCAKPATKKKGKKHNGKNASEPSSSVSIYRGPVLPPGYKGEEELFTVPFGLQVSLQSSVAGVAALVYSSSPASATDWAAAQAFYDEYRVLALRLKFFPTNRYSKTTTISRPAVTYVDRDDTSLPTSYGTATKKASSVIRSLEDPWTQVIKMDGIEDAAFFTTATVVNAFSLKLYADGLSISTEYGMMFIEYLVQFRGRGTV